MSHEMTPRTTKKELASLRTAGPLSLVLQQQEQAWLKGNRVPLEQLVESLPNDLTSSNNILCLISNEVYLRELGGETPHLTEYQRRFPSLAEALEIQWGIDHLLSVPLSTGPNSSLMFNETQVGSLIDKRYRVQHLLGQGGMGIVYQALDTKLNRVVALKCLVLSRLSNLTDRKRFRTEASTIAKLSHPHIVQVYDIGELTDEAYISMEYCDGGSLADWLRKGPLVAKCAAKICNQIASAIASAHAVNVIHRDLKPGNILLTKDSQANIYTTVLEKHRGNGLGDVPAWLVAKVADFGLAKQTDGDHPQTTTGDIVGTPAYMAPEQIAGWESGQEHLVDVYSIGAILYECLAGRPPIRGGSVLETLQLLQTQEPVRLRLLQPLVPVDLETITHKCLQREPRHRYPTAMEIANDLQRFLRGEPIHAKPVPTIQRMIKWARRHRAVATASATAAMALIGLGISWGLFTYRLGIAKEQAESERVIANKQRDRAERNSEWAMQAVDELITKVGDQSLANIPGMDSTRKSLLESAVQFCKKFQADSDSSDPEARNQVALSHRRLAKIYRTLGETEAWQSELESAAKIHRELVSEFPDQETYLSELGKTLNNLANVVAHVQGPDASILVTEEAIAIKESLVKNNPQSQSHRSSLATSLYAIGPKYRVSSPEKAEASYKRSEALWSDLLQEDPNNAEFMKGASGLYNNYISLLVAQGRPDDALRLLDKHDALLRARTSVAQDSQFHQPRLNNLHLRGIVLMHSRNHQLACDVFREQRELIKQQLHDFPDRQDLKNTLLHNLFNLGNVCRELGDQGQAIEIGNEGLDLARTWLTSSPNNPEAISAMLRISAIPIAAELERNDAEKSLELALDADEIVQAFLTAKNSPPDLTALACNILFYKGIALYRLNRPNDALETHLQSLTKITQQYRNQPKHADTSRLMVLISANCVLQSLRQGDYEKAQRILTQSQELWPPEKSWSLRAIQSMADAMLGNHAQAIEILSEELPTVELIDIWPDRITVIIASECARQVMNDASLTPSNREDLRKKYVELAVRELESAGSEYYDNPLRRQWLRQTKELDSLSMFPELQEKRIRLSAEH
jgi:serine/threonine protein kinase/tetratricopeptide (TPR) repeat protein